MNWIWKKSDLIPRDGLLAWYQYEKNTVSSGLIPDFSGNGRDLTAKGVAPELTENVWRGNPAWVFDGTADPLSWENDVQARHIFLVMAFTEAELTGDYQGVLSGLEIYDLLTGVGGTDVFFDFSTELPDLHYRKAGKFFAANNQKAPVEGQVAVIELVSVEPIQLDGIQFGQQRDLTDRRGQFNFFESLFYQHIKSSCERRDIFQYFAERYHVWPVRADDKAIFPFIFNRASEHQEVEAVEVSEAEGERAKDRIVRYLTDPDEPLQTYNFQFLNRFQREYQAARVFLREHRVHLPFWLHDIERDQFVQITRDSALASTGTTAFRLNYQFQGRLFDYVEVTDIALPIEPEPDTTNPSIPTGLTATTESATEISLTWNAANDNVGVTGYELRVNGGEFTNEILDVGNNLDHTHSGLDADTQYDYEVRAYDAAGNRSGWSSADSALTDPPSAINVALSSNGASASANRTDLGTPANCINGSRIPAGSFNTNGFQANGSTAWVEVNFNQSRTINEINIVFANASDSNNSGEPTLSTLGGFMAAPDFTVEYWNGAAWVVIATVTGNDKQWRQFMFAALSTTKIRLNVSQTSGGALYFLEIEALGF